MTVILGISGSLRRESFNTLLLQAAAEELPPGAELVRWDDLKAVPPFDADDEGPERPPAVADLAAAIEAADAVLFATPEYNAGVPGQLKNAVDWLSRPLRTNPLRGQAGRRRRREHRHARRRRRPGRPAQGARAARRPGARRGRRRAARP
jgi:chromate reductase